MSDDAPHAWTFGQQRADDGNFHQPRGLALTPESLLGEGSALSPLYVVDRSGRIQGFDLDGSHRVTWRIPIPDPVLPRGFPVGMAWAPDGTLLVANTHDYRVMRLDAEGQEIASYGRRGSGPDEFEFPVRIAVLADGRYFVSEYGQYQHRIHRMTPDGQCDLVFGQFGTGPGEFQRPNGICLGPEQRELFVCDANNHRIQVFDVDTGAYLRSFSPCPGESADYSVPYGICYEAGGDRLLVADFALGALHCLSRDGTWQGSWRPPEDMEPCRGLWDVVCTAEAAYMADRGNHRVVVVPLALLPPASGETPPQTSP